MQLLERFHIKGFWRIPIGGFPVWSWRDSMLFPIWRDSSIGRIPIGKFPLSVLKGFPFWGDSPHIKGRKWRGWTLLDWGLRGSTWDWGLREVERPIREVWVFNRNLTQPFLNSDLDQSFPENANLPLNMAPIHQPLFRCNQNFFSAEISRKL